MQIKISDLKEIIKNSPDEGKVFVHIREYEVYEQYDVERISSNPIHLNLDVRRNIGNTITISEIREAINRYDEKSYIQFMLIDPRFQISRGGAFDKAETDTEGNLHFYTYLQPSPVI